MAFIHQVSFDIPSDQPGELAIGASLERTIGYLRTLLPSEAGYVTARAMNSVGLAEKTHVVFQSVWETWDDLVAHRESRLTEGKVLVEFGGTISRDALSVRDYEDVA
jgi:hypothetical protein